MSAQTLDGLATFLYASLSPENRLWLADKLSQPTQQRPAYTMDEINARIDLAEEQMRTDQCIDSDEMDRIMDHFIESHSIQMAV